MAYNYAEVFRPQIQSLYDIGLRTTALTDQGVSFMGAKIIRMPTLTVSGYKDHSRDCTWNKGTLENQWFPYELQHDRDIQFCVDAMDVDETAQVLSAANITSRFINTQEIPELDAYRFSKMFPSARLLTLRLPLKTSLLPLIQ